jgi:hypothetical protein
MIILQLWCRLRDSGAILGSADIGVLELVGPGVVHEGIQAHVEVGENGDIDCDVTIIEGDVDVDDVFAGVGADMVHGGHDGMPSVAMQDIGVPRYRAVYIKDCVKVLAAELSTLRRNAPCIWGSIEKDGRVHVLFSADNTSRPLFNGSLAKIEQGILKILLPGVEGPQQAPFLTIPVFFHEGDETYRSISYVMEKMMESDGLGRVVNVEGHNGAETVTLAIEYLICGDFKLLALVTGFGGAGCSQPCPWCTWSRDGKTGEAKPRSDATLKMQTAWAEQFLGPILTAQAALAEARKRCKEDKTRALQLDGVAKRPMDKAFAESSERVERLMEVVKGTYEAVRGRLAEPSDEVAGQLRTAMNDAFLLQGMNCHQRTTCR